MDQPHKAFHTFDELKAGLRFISTLIEEEATGMNRKDLIDHMQTQGVSQNQVYKSIKTLTHLGLIEETQTRRGNVKSIQTRLTHKGRQVAELAKKINQTLTRPQHGV